MKRYAVLLFYLMAVSVCMHGAAPCTDHGYDCESDGDLLVMFWNLENFFDWTDSGTSASDREFSSAGERHWTKGRFYVKCRSVAKTVMWAGSRYGRMPDVAGFAEVENGFVVRSVIFTAALEKYGYAAVHYDSCDPRGIDVALIYRKDVFRCKWSRPYRIAAGGVCLATRDILHVCLERRDGGERYDFIVNHHPSKYGGEKESYPRRIAAMSCLRHIADSLLEAGHCRVVAMGDFNDTPDGDAFRITEDVLHDMSAGMCGTGKGTIRYQGKWELIDNFLVSDDIGGRSSMEICRPPFLLVPDSSYPGMKPFRTYSGPRYAGGVSDHLPVVLKIKGIKTDEIHCM